MLAVICVLLSTVACVILRSIKCFFLFSKNKLWKMAPSEKMKMFTDV